MPRFSCVAFDDKGHQCAEDIEAPSEGAALEQMRKRNLTVVEIKENSDTTSTNGDIHSLDKATPAGKIPIQIVLNFYEQLAFLLKSGIPIFTAVRMLSETFNNKNLVRVLKDVLFVLSEGYPLSLALQKYPQSFPNFHTSLISVGETSGNIDESLGQLVDLVQERLGIRQNLIKAAAYPIFLLFLSLLLVFGLLLFVFPKFQEIFIAFKVKLPPLTQFFITASETLRNDLFEVGGATILLFLGIGYFFTSEKTSRTRDKVFLKIPVVRDIFISMFVATFAKTFANLVRAGIPILSALGICKDTINGQLKQEFFDHIISFVKEGEPASKGMEGSPLIPEMAYQLVLVAETTGQIDQMMENIFHFYKRRYGEMLNTLTAIVQPILMLFAAGLIAMVAISLFVPLFKLSSSMKGNS